MKKNDSQELVLPLDRVVAFHPVLAHVCGGINEALLLQQIYFWRDKGAREDGFIYKTKEELERETTLTRRQQDRARKHLESLDFIETTVKKVNKVTVVHYRVKIENVQKAIGYWESTKGTFSKVQKVLSLLYRDDYRNNTKSPAGSVTFSESETNMKKRKKPSTIPYILDLWKFWKKEDANDSSPPKDKKPTYLAKTMSRQFQAHAIGGDPETYVAFLFFWWLVNAKQFAFSNSKYVAWAQEQVAEFLGEYEILRQWNDWDYNQRMAWVDGFGVHGLTYFGINIVQNGITPKTMLLP